MRGVESILRRLFEGRTRRWSVITINAVLVLALGLPAADEYLASLQKEKDLATQLADAQEQVQRADELRRRANQVSTELQTMKSRALSDKDAQAYRKQLVNQIRESGCHLRKLNLGNPANREWIKDDHPLAKPKKLHGKKKEESVTGYRLHEQTVSLSVTGSLHDTRSFLQQLQAKGKLMHTTHLSIRPTGRDRNNVVMELEFILFSLQKAGHAGAAA